MLRVLLFLILGTSLSLGTATAAATIKGNCTGRNNAGQKTTYEVRKDPRSGRNYSIYTDGLPDPSLYFVMYNGDLVILKGEQDEPILQNIVCDDAVMELLGY